MSSPPGRTAPTSTTHQHIDRQQALGLYGAFIIDPKDPADVYDVDQELDF